MRAGRAEAVGIAVAVASSEIRRTNNRTKPVGVTAILNTVDKVEYGELFVVHAYVISRT